ncbi:MAG: hypothetical protein A3I66_08910 [Burkholderiales bacterium RIFCSPLOWO2_02_FULL_57_36]|nr:MAG: hypothetical protein A3I66_08910 [Burkholderiales bacterium RIFCSPLOWO2_02_FULL_57_36]
MREQEQQAQLTKMRRLATGLLVLMAVVFVGARLLQPTYGYMSFVGAFAEAAMVGALADWFAVTALFRRPLGLPIPHTAIIPNNKDRIGDSVGNFLEHNFMTPEVLGEELKQVDFAGAAAAWLVLPENSRAVSAQMVSGIPALFRMFEDRDVVSFMQTAITGALKNMKFAPLAAEILSVLMTDRRHQLLFDHFLRLATKSLEQNKPLIRQKIHERSPRWIPKIVDEKFFVNLVDELRSILNEMKEENSEWRNRFELSAQELIEKLRTSPEYEEKISTAVNEILAHPLFRDYADHVWHDARQRLIADATSDNSQAVARLDMAIHTFSEALMQDAVVQEKLNRWIREFATEAISSRREGIADLFRRVIRKWDAETVSRKFELYVGKDLQYIRINGTLVGGLVGLVLHSFSLAL